ncbi:universal stress protein [Gordonia sp. (in: high G+C Gram-positive bacteria)]|uniref:universal stress protein n=1 Tax=Gordonia sp. (in: high G+C Gram-positive bacteria) TaxID=84139 RepID=UPI0039E6DB69
MSIDAKTAVVAAVDGSANGLDGVRWAATAAARQKRDLQIVSVVELPTAPHFGEVVNTAAAYTDASRAFAEEALDIAKNVAGEAAPGVAVDTAVLDGRPAAVLQELTATAHTLVVGRRGRGRVEALLLGSVSSHLAAHAECPVVVVPESPSTTGPVVVGVDGSELSAAAVDLAFQAANDLGAKLVAVHTYGDGVISQGLYEEDMGRIARAASAFLDSELAEGRAAYPKVAVETVVTGAESAEEILGAATDGQLVVVGTRGHGGFAGMLLGSTSQAVLHAAPCAVMVVPKAG